MPGPDPPRPSVKIGLFLLYCAVSRRLARLYDIGGLGWAGLSWGRSCRVGAGEIPVWICCVTLMNPLAMCDIRLRGCVGLSY